MWNFTNSGEKAAVLPVICSIVLMAAAQVVPMSLLADLIDPFYEKNAQAALTVYMIILIIVSFGMQWLFERWFYPEYKGSMTWEGLGAGMRYILPALLFIAAWRAFKIGMGYETLDRPGYYLILMGARAGINEEVAFRGIGTALLIPWYD